MNTVELRHKRNPKDFGDKQFRQQNWKSFDNAIIGRALYLFGSGKACEEFLIEYKDKYPINGIIENDEGKIGTELNGYSIISLSSIVEVIKENIVVLITSTRFDNEIGQQLREAGYTHVFSIYTLEVKKNYSLKKEVYDFFFAYHFGIFSFHQKFYNYVVFHILALLRIAHFPPACQYYKGIMKYKNMHKGEKCFVIATGPSLTISDIEMIRDSKIITFGMNTIMNLFNDVVWKPDYYAIEDPKFMSIFDWNDDKYNLDNVCNEAAFLPGCYIKKCRKFKKVQFYPISYLGHLMDHTDHSMLYSRNLLWGIYCAYTVTNVCIQLAEWMGFSEVYLIGVDCNYMGEKKHFSKEIDEKKYTKTYAQEAYDNLIRGYEFIHVKAEKHGMRIYNATRGGMLEVFPRIRLEDVCRI